MFKQRDTPTPDQLKQQLLGASAALRFVQVMRAQHGRYWEKHANEVLAALSSSFYDLGADNTDAAALWKVLSSQAPPDKVEELINPLPG